MGNSCGEDRDPSLRSGWVLGGIPPQPKEGLDGAPVSCGSSENQIRHGTKYIDGFRFLFAVPRVSVPMTSRWGMWAMIKTL
jgi:hypothetical protein